MNSPVLMQFSTAAQAHLMQCVVSHAAAAVRFEMKPDGCAGFGYHVTFPKVIPDEDISFKVEALIVVVAVNSINMLAGVKVDLVKQSLGQKQLVFDNPHVQSECGCGLSVQMKAKDQ